MSQECSVLNSIILKIENIKASYYKKEILKGVSLDLKEGEIVSLIGPNGAGKSTLLKVIFGLLVPTEGKIEFKGNDVTKNKPYENVKGGIGYFIQGGQVFTDLNVIENLEMGFFQKQNTPFEERKGEILNLFPSLKKYINKRAGLLSGGEKQMLALGMLLIRKPKILLLDEPSAGLAPSIVISLIDIIKQVRDKYKASIFLVEQNIKEAMRISDRCYLLKSGAIEAEGKPEEIIQNGELEKAFLT